MPRIYFIGVDVGTSSARAALVASDGKVVAQAVKPIQVWNPEHEHYEQSSEDIWSAVCHCVRQVASNVAREEIVAISFDATCSLVVLGMDGKPLSVSNSRDPQHNVMLWMDHRAHAEAAVINDTEHALLAYVGGRVSVEMEMPKLLWLKNNAYFSTWKNMWRAFDLSDFLTWRCTDCDVRSLCSVVCKWNYDASQMRWDKSFLQSIGLADLCKNDFEIIGKDVCVPGEPVGQGLTTKAAAELNLQPGTIVGSALIDAHAGALGLFGCQPMPGTTYAYGDRSDVESKLALICGTSTCHMSLTRTPCLAEGIWGPYKSAIIPDLFLNEAGQSATGLLLDHVVKTHPQYIHIERKLEKDEHIYSYLNDLLVKMAEEQHMTDPCFLTRDLHVWPDFHGNRAPVADASLKGMISGLNMNINEESLAVTYLAFVQALAYGTRHIIDSLRESGRVEFTTLLVSGGLGKNPLYVKSHADICQLPVVVPKEQEMVLVGAAMLGACAAKVYNSLLEASTAMGGVGEVLMPKEQTYDFHKRKYSVFLNMLHDQRKYGNIMADKCS